MIKTYRKIATIQAEQFDGSAGKLAILMDKYHITERIWSTNIHEYFIETLEGQMELSIGDWIATGIKGEHWAIADDVFKASYVEVTE